MNVIEKNITLADGRVITLETGKLAKQADGAVMLKMQYDVARDCGFCSGCRS